MPRFSASCLSLTLVGVLTLSVANAYAQTTMPKARATGVVFQVDGSSPIPGMGDDLRQVVAEAHLPLKVENFTWSHGPLQILADLHGHDHQKVKGQQLAEAIVARRRASPAGRVYLICHSAGAAVVLAAAAHLPPRSVDRIVLLAPALGPGCDLRPALSCARDGVDAFHSQNDLVGRLLAVFGNADGQFQVSAGSVGFATPRDVAENDPLYRNLRQHAWEWDMCKTTHFGGHFGCTRAGFLREYLVPLLD